jgi:hypothetical protein
LNQRRTALRAVDQRASVASHTPCADKDEAFNYGVARTPIRCRYKLYPCLRLPGSGLQPAAQRPFQPGRGRRARSSDLPGDAEFTRDSPAAGYVYFPHIPLEIEAGAVILRRVKAST